MIWHQIGTQYRQIPSVRVSESVERESWTGVLVWGTMHCMSCCWTTVQPCVHIIVISIPAHVVFCCFSIFLLSFIQFLLQQNMSKQIISKQKPNFIVDIKAKMQAVIWLCMKYSGGFQTAESPASLGPLLLAEIQTHQTPSSPRKQAAFSYQHTCNHTHERP